MKKEGRICTLHAVHKYRSCKSLKKFIEENSDHIIIVGGIDDKKVREIEKELDVKLPQSYSYYLKEYGTILGFGVEFLGCGKNGLPPVVRETLRNREFGLLRENIVVRSADEWIYCLNSLTGIISSWDRGNKGYTFVANDFEEYIFSTLEEAKEDW